MEGQIIGCPNASKNNATFSIRWNIFEDDIPEEWAISTYPSNDNARNNLRDYITRFEEWKQPPTCQEEEIPPPPAIFQEQLSPAPVAAAAAAAVSSPSQPAGMRSNQHRTPSTAERFSWQMELCTQANTFDLQNDNHNENINNPSTLESDEDDNDPDFCAIKLFPPSTDRRVTTRANQPTTDNDDSSLSDEDNYHPDIGFALDAPGRSEYAYIDDVDDNKEIDKDDNEEVVNLSNCMRP